VEKCTDFSRNFQKFLRLSVEIRKPRQRREVGCRMHQKSKHMPFQMKKEIGKKIPSLNLTTVVVPRIHKTGFVSFIN